MTVALAEMRKNSFPNIKAILKSCLYLIFDKTVHFKTRIVIFLPTLIRKRYSDQKVSLCLIFSYHAACFVPRQRQNQLQSWSLHHSVCVVIVFTFRLHSQIDHSFILREIRYFRKNLNKRLISFLLHRKYWWSQKNINTMLHHINPFKIFFNFPILVWLFNFGSLKLQNILDEFRKLHVNNTDLFASQ